MIEHNETEATGNPASDVRSAGGSQRLLSFILGILTGLFLQIASSYLPITRARIAHVVEGPPEEPAPFEIERVGNDLITVHAFTETFKNKGITTGRIDRVEPVVVGSAASGVDVFVRYFDRGPIHGLQTRDVRVEYLVRIPIRKLRASPTEAEWRLYFYDDSGNEVGWVGRNFSWGQGEIPPDPFPSEPSR